MNMQLFNYLLPFLMLFTGVLNLVIGIDGLRRSKDPKEIEKKRRERTTGYKNAVETYCGAVGVESVLNFLDSL